MKERYEREDHFIVGSILINIPQEPVEAAYYVSVEFGNV